MHAFKTFWNGLDWSVLTDILVSIIPALLCITLHELAHGYTAYLLGDRTAKDRGRLTLNPLKHIDPLGLALMVVFKFGWAKPVPVNMYNFKKPRKGMAITAIAGPLMNLFITCIMLFVYGLIFYPLTKNGGIAAEAILDIVGTASYLSLALALFNIIPIPPLDGSKVVFSVLGDRAYYRLMQYERYGMIVLFLIVASGSFSGYLSTATGAVYDNLFFIAQWGYDIVLKLVKVI